MNSRNRYGMLVILLASILAASPAMAINRLPAEKGEPFYAYQAGDVLVKFEAGMSAQDVSARVAAIGGRVARYSDLLGFHTVELDTGRVEETVAFFRGQPEVEWANFNYLARPCWRPNDPYYSYQWHFPRINMEPAWDITRGNSSVIIALCDQGWQFNHPDWAGVDIVSPHDYIDGDSDPSSPAEPSHGMLVAGTMVAATNNRLGVASIAPECQLMPIRVMNDADPPEGTLENVANGVAWAGSHGAHVLNLSIGFEVTGPPPDPGEPLRSAIQQTAAGGTVIVAASGNDGQPYVGYPAAYSQCIAVGATGYDDALAPYSNTGTQLDLVAPGGNLDQDLNHDTYGDGVLSTVRYQGQWAYVFMEGTSMASPHVAAVAALIISRGLPAAEVRPALQETAADLGTPGRDDTFGYGRINAYEALRWLDYAEPPAALPHSLRLGLPYPNPFNGATIIPIELSWPARVELAIYNVVGQRVTTLRPLSMLAAGSHRFTWNADGQASGLYFVKLAGSGIEKTKPIVLVR